MKKNNKSTFIMVLFFFIGLAVLFYPAISNYSNEKLQSKSIDKYEKILSSIEEEDYSSYFDKAHDYNTKLMELSNPLVNYKKLGSTADILNVGGNGMMGYLLIDKLKVELPIYYGTTPQILNTSVGLLEGTSYPIGETNTHAVLAAHRGLPSSKLFSDLDELEIGDLFKVNILDRTLTYEVDQITIVKPDELENIKVLEQEEYVTLMTCTPYGINTHRLLIRGHRVENVRNVPYISTEAFKINRMVVTPIICLPILFIWLILIAFAPIERNIDYKMKYVYPNKYKNLQKKKGIKK